MAVRSHLPSSRLSVGGDAGAGSIKLLVPRRWFTQVLPGLRLALERRDLVGIYADHQIIDVVVDLRKPVASAGRNHHDVARLDVVRHAVPNLRSGVSRAVELHDGAECRRPSLAVDDVWPQDERGRT